MSAETDRLKLAYKRLIRSMFPNYDYLARYPATVVAQGADGTLDVVPDDPKAAPLHQVPLRKPFPDMDIRVAPKARVLIAYEGGLPSKPVAELWDSGSVLSIRIGTAGSTFEIDALQVKLGGAAAIQPLVLGTLNATLETTYDAVVIAALATANAAILAAQGTPGYPTPPLLAQCVSAIATFLGALNTAQAARQLGRPVTLSAVSKTL